MKKCIIFSRVSTLQQDLKQQTNELYKEAHNCGYSDDCIIPIEYKESAIKLSIDDRRGIQKLYQIINTNPDVDCIFVYEISRLSRQAGMIFELRDYFINHSIQLIIIKPYIRLLEDGKMSPNALIMFSVFSAVSESEMMIKKERLIRGIRSKKEQNKFSGGRVLFGYKVDENDNIIIDEDEADSVRKMFLWYSQGKSLSWIGNELMSRGKLTRYKTERNMKMMIGYILKKQDYTGVKTLSYTYPQIVSNELYNKCQELRKKNKEKTVTKRHSLLKSLLFEKETNQPLISQMDRYSNYNININRKEEDKVTKEHLFTINADKIENWVIEKVKMYIEMHRESFRQDEQLRVQHDMRVIDEKIYTLQQLNKQKEKNIETTERRIIEGKMNEQRGDAMIDEYYEQIRINNEEIDILNAKLEELSTEVSESIYDVDIDKLDTIEKNSLLKKIINKVQISKLPNGIYTTVKGKENNNLRQRNIEILFKDESKMIGVYKFCGRINWID